jgi:hypothetical protein
VTYNFDPDHWLSLQLAALDERRQRGELDDAEYHRERGLLEQRHEQMLDGLDRSFELPRAARPAMEPGDSGGGKTGCS